MANYKVVDADQLDRAIQSTADAVKAKTSDYSSRPWDMEKGFTDAVNGMVSGEAFISRGTIDFPYDTIDRTKFIGQYAFSYMWFNNGDITLPENTYIQPHAFYNSFLTSIVIPNSVSYIGYNAFESSSITSIKFPNNDALTLEDSMCRQCQALQAVELPSNLTFIPYQMFEGCSVLAGIVLPDTLTEIRYGAFSGSGLTQIEIPDSVTAIRGSAFSNCQQLASVTLPTGLEVLEWGAFSGTAISSVEIPSLITTIESNVFQSCANLKNVTFHDGITQIGSYAFSGCTSLESIELPSGLTSMRYGVFENCTSLKNVTIPTSLESNEGSLFYGCTSLEYIILRGDNVLTLNPWDVIIGTPLGDTYTGAIYIEPVSEGVDVNELVAQYKESWEPVYGTDIANMIKPITELSTEEVVE